MEEMYDVYTKDGEFLGTRPASVCKSENPGFYYKVVRIILLNENNEILIQKRSALVKYCPLKWELSASGRRRVAGPVRLCGFYSIRPGGGEPAAGPPDRPPDPDRSGKGSRRQVCRFQRYAERPPMPGKDHEGGPGTADMRGRRLFHTSDRRRGRLRWTTFMNSGRKSGPGKLS